jgi:hypothetical protein
MPMAVQNAVALPAQASSSFWDCRNVQDVGEVHVGAGQMWIPQFGDRLCKFFGEMGVMLGDGMCDV